MYLLWFEEKLDYIETAQGIIGHPIFWAPFIQLGNNNPIQLKQASNWAQMGLILAILGLSLLGTVFLKFKRKAF